jgi:tetratricopeptide (TPR) repeat protein
LTWASGSVEQAVPFLEKAIGMQEELLTARPQEERLLEDLAYSYLSLGALHEKTKRYVEARRALNQTRKLLEPLALEGPRRAWALMIVARMKQNDGVYASRAGEVVEARAATSQACELWEQLVRLSPDDPFARAGLAGSCTNLASLFHQAGDFSEPAKQYKKALALLEQLVREQPQTRVFRTALIQTCHQLAAWHIRQNQREEAIAALDKARLAHEAMALRSPDVLEQRRYAATHALNLGRAKLPAKRFAEAREHFQTADNLFEQLQKAAPTDPTLAYERVRSLTYLGMVQLALRQRRAALSSFHGALALLAPIAREAPERSEAPQEQGQTCYLLGAGLRQAGQQVDGIPALRQAVAWQRVALARAPKVVAIRKTLSASCFELGEALRAAGRLAEAAATCRERQKLWPDNADETYDAACELGRCAVAVKKGKTRLPPQEQAEHDRYLEEAMAVLRRAVALGLRDPRGVRRDEDMQPLLARADFKKLLEEMEKRERAEPK